jgi:hypothetical protein
MYCPKCSQQIASEELRFCSRCGFKLDIVKACLTADAAPSYPIPTPQSGINLGVILMFLGTLLTSGVIAAADLKLAGGFLLLAVTFLSILLSSRPLLLALHTLSSVGEPPTAHTSERRKEVSIGATLMFIGTLLSAFAALLVPGRMGGLAFFSVLLLVFTSLLFSSRRLMRAAQGLLTGGEVRAIDGPRSLAVSGLTAEVETVSEASAVPGGPGLPVRISDARGHTTGEIVTPPSVTERTTSLLEKE